MTDDELVAQMIVEHFNSLGYKARFATEFSNISYLVGIDYPNEIRDLYSEIKDDIALYDVVLLISMMFKGVSIVYGPKHRDYDPADPDFLTKLEEDIKYKNVL